MTERQDEGQAGEEEVKKVVEPEIKEQVLELMPKSVNYKKY